MNEEAINQCQLLKVFLEEEEIKVESIVERLNALEINEDNSIEIEQLKAQQESILLGIKNLKTLDIPEAQGKFQPIAKIVKRFFGTHFKEANIRKIQELLNFDYEEGYKMPTSKTEEVLAYLQMAMADNFGAMQATKNEKEKENEVIEGKRKGHEKAQRDGT